MPNGQGVFALKKFYQGRVIFDGLSRIELLTHSNSPNAVVRNGRVIAWTCIAEGDEITIDQRKLNEAS